MVLGMPFPPIGPGGGGLDPSQIAQLRDTTMSEDLQSEEELRQ